MSDSDKKFDGVFREVVSRSHGELRMPLKRACLILGVAYQTISNKRALGVWDQDAMKIDKDPISGRLFVSAWEVARLVCGNNGFERDGVGRVRRGAPSLIEKRRAESQGVSVAELRGEIKNG